GRAERRYLGEVPQPVSLNSSSSYHAAARAVIPRLLGICAIDRGVATSQVKHRFFMTLGTSTVAKPDPGTKRVCPDTGRKFYDLNKTLVISPYTGKVVPIAAPAPSRARPEAPVAAKPVAQTESIVPETAEAEFVSL